MLAVEGVILVRGALGRAICSGKTKIILIYIWGAMGKMYLLILGIIINDVLICIWGRGRFKGSFMGVELDCVRFCVVFLYDLCRFNMICGKLEFF